jgi:acylphosphatase
MAYSLLGVDLISLQRSVRRVRSSAVIGLRSTVCSATLTTQPLMVRYYLVKGRVQGVGFRWFVHREAAALDLRGWVRNTESGHVEVVASGDEDTLKRLEAQLARGSRGSRVDRIERRDLDPSEADDLGPFQIEGAW